ncbi:MAG: hydroxymethylpyrimidine kinase/phosphomethylpyrimidine kinase [Myxococcota bacterium]
MAWSWPIALTIAGSDSGGGAGVQADLKTFMDHGVFGTSAVVAITAQNTRGVTRVDPVPVDGVRAQIDAVLSDMEVAVIKIGMLGTAALASAVCDALDAHDWRGPLVVDPVMVASTGHRLLDDDAVAVVRDRLLPRCTVSTPNLDEARVLAGADSREDLERWAAAQPAAVLLTGGDVVGSTIDDTLIQGSVSRRWTGPRIGDRAFHGTGCTLSSAIAARLAHGDSLEAAVDHAIRYVRSLIMRSSGSPGGGNPALPHGLS